MYLFPSFLPAEPRGKIGFLLVEISRLERFRKIPANFEILSNFRRDFVRVEICSTISR